MQPNNSSLPPLDNQQEPQGYAGPPAGNQFFQPSVPYPQNAPYGQSPQPPGGMSQPVNPNPYAFQDQYAVAAQPVTKKRLKPLVIVGGMITVTVLALVGSYLLLPSRSGSNSSLPAATVFNNALSNSLSTKQLTQTKSTAAGTFTSLFDVTNPKDPRVSTKVDIAGESDPIRLETYGTVDDSHFRITDEESAFASASTVDKWVSLRLNGTLETTSDSALLALADPRSSLLGPVLFGNYSNTDKQALLTFVNDKKLYTYDESKVFSATAEGQDSYVFDVTLNADEIKNYWLLAAEKMGLSTTTARELVAAQEDLGTTARFYISLKDQRFVKTEITTPSNTAITAIFSQVDATTLPAAPTASLTYSQFSTQSP